jgi:hypothetical protein
MSAWIPIDRWAECEQLQRPGIIFELQNLEGRSLFSSCTLTLPALPFDWKSAPVRFRVVQERKPEHSGDLPAPQR